MGDSNEGKYVKINAGFTEIKLSDYIKKWEAAKPKEYWEYRRKWYEYPKKQIVANFPLHLALESTRKCNLRCPMCQRTLKLERGEKLQEGDLDFELFKKVIDEGASNGLYSVKLNLLGEPLLCKDIVKMVATAKEKGIIDVMFNTNGVLLTEDISKQLIKAGLDKIFVSFDSPFKKRYEKIRVGARFDRVLENIKNFVRLRNEAGIPGPIVRASMVVMEENKEEVLDYIKLFKPIVDLISFADYANPQGMDEEERHAVDLVEHPNFVCSQLYQRLIVLYNGKIGLCCADRDAKCDLGHVKDVNIKDVWLGERMQKIRVLHTSGQFKKVAICAKCEQPYF